MLAKLQLSAVGVSVPESSIADPSLLPLVEGGLELEVETDALWKSPKSPNPSNDASSESSSENEDVNVNGSVPLAAAESEKGPKASCENVMSYYDSVCVMGRWAYVVEGIHEGTAGGRRRARVE